jgi:hypothetical protein
MFHMSVKLHSHIKEKKHGGVMEISSRKQGTCFDYNGNYARYATGFNSWSYIIINYLLLNVEIE